MVQEEGVEVNTLAVSEDVSSDSGGAHIEAASPTQEQANDEEPPSLADLESPAPTKKHVDIDSLVTQLEAAIDAEKIRYNRVIYVMWIVAAVFLLVWVVGLPLAIAFTEDWTYQAAWYFSIQAGLGIGYGALTVQSQGMEIFLSLHLLLGAVSISFLVAYLLSRMIDSTEEKKKSKARIAHEELGNPIVGWKSWVIGLILLFFVFVGGILYGMLYEKWNFTESLYFIISTCQTSGLLAPTIRAKDPNNLFAPLFVSFLALIAVPVWAYNIGKTSVELVNLDRAQRRQSSVMERDQCANDVFVKLAPSMGIDVSEPGNIQVTLAGFLVQLMLFHKVTNEAVLKDVIAEFNGYLEPGGRQEGTAPYWKIKARVRFLQLVQIGLLERDDWEAFCEEARHVKDKSIIIHGSATRGGESGAEAKVSRQQASSAELEPPEDGMNRDL